MKEIWDRIEADYVEESQIQIPNPELGPLERRVGLTYEDALFSDDINVKDTEYWFTEPEGTPWSILHRCDLWPSMTCLSECHGTAQDSNAPAAAFLALPHTSKRNVLGIAQRAGTRSPSAYRRPRSCQTSGQLQSTLARAG